VEVGFYGRFNIDLDDHLRYPVRHRGHSEDAFSPVLFGNFHRFHRWGEIAAGRHSIPNLVEVVLQVLLECLQAFVVYSRRSLVRFHSLERLQHYMLGDFVRLCFVHWFLPCG